MNIKISPIRWAPIPGAWITVAEQGRTNYRVALCVPRSPDRPFDAGFFRDIGPKRRLTCCPGIQFMQFNTLFQLFCIGKEKYSGWKWPKVSFLHRRAELFVHRCQKN